YGAISGVVYKDIPLSGDTSNIYGVKEDNELGVEGVEVVAYDKDGNIAAKATTNRSGEYLLDVEDGEYRVEFSSWPSYLKESMDGKSSNSSVRFAKDGDIVNFGLYYSGEYCQLQPKVASVFQTNGLYYDEDPDYDDIFGVFDYNETNPENIDFVAKKVDLGSVWGIAYSRKRELFYTSTFFRRHSDIGPSGTGAIYQVDPVTKEVETLAVIPDAGQEPENRDINGSRQRNHDSEAFKWVGKIGLGDIDISEDEKYLYVVNLNNTHIYKVDIEAKSPEDLGEVNHPLCVGGSWRPFALKVYEGKVYIGGVCDASESKNRDDLKAHIVAFEEGATPADAKSVLSFDLNYTRQGLDDNGNVVVNSQQQTIKDPDTGETIRDPNFPLLHPWVEEWDPFELGQKEIDEDGNEVWRYKDSKDKANEKVLTVHTQPWLMDIEFDARGEMYIGIGDRTGYQFGSGNWLPDENDTTHLVYIVGAGDILKATKDESGNWIIEEEVTSGDVAEFFIGDNFPKSPNHKEVSNGGVATISGANELFLTAMDPHDYSQGGVYRLSKSDGDRINAVELYDGSLTSEPFFGKASGMGDVELLCELPPIEIGNRVWLDSNGNGIQDAGEEGIAGVKVQLIDENSNIIAEVTTNSKGEYLFSSDATKSDEEGYDYNVTLESGKSYKVVIDTTQEAINGKVLTSPNQQADSSDPDLVDSDAILEGDSAVVEVQSLDFGVNNHSLDIGFMPVVSLGSIIWEDSNNNGVQDSGEVGIEGLKVTLLDEQNQEVKWVVTNSNGVYYFDNLAPGKYRVKIESNVTSLDGYSVNMDVQNSFADDNNKSDSNIEEVGQDYILSALITLEAQSEPVGEDEVSEIENSGDDADDMDDANGNMTLDIGLVKRVCIGDFVWEDSDLDGIQDSTEGGLKDVNVSLYLDDKLIDTLVTDESGKYEFCDLKPQVEYKLVFKAPDNYSPTPKDMGGDDSKDSDIDENAEVVVKVDSSDDTIDAGFYKRVCIGDFVWEDSNKNGIQDEGEVGIEGVEVILYISIPTQEIENVEAARVTTDENGTYKFCDIPVGYEVKLKFEAPQEYLVTEQNIGDDNLDSDINESKEVVVGEVSEDDMSIDAGLYRVGSIGDYVWEDIDKDGVQDDNESGVGGVVVSLKDKDGNIISQTITTGEGKYQFSNIEPGEYLVEFAIPEGYIATKKDATSDDLDSDVDSDGRVEVEIKSGENNLTIDMGIYKPESPTYCVGDFVWEDSNKNGVQDSGEVGIEGVVVEIYDINNTLKGSATSDSSGSYRVCGLENGEYYAKFSIPEGHMVTLKNQGGDDSRDSDLDENGVSDRVKIDGEDNSSLDGGFYRLTYCLGDFIWEDSNKNGIQDEGEVGVGGVKITLNETGATTITDSNGKYEFCGLGEGNYSITIDKTTLPEGYIITKQNAGDEEKDSDINPETGVSDYIEIKDSNITTLDGGVYKEEVNQTTYCLGDFIWED
ncbi:MAG: hypothetical protein GXO06_01205, partial [Epsilonproteobacteria bacterium]|nr:hypothetical protein [Campylobacterota bacterium]